MKNPDFYKICLENQNKYFNKKCIKDYIDSYIYNE